MRGLPITVTCECGATGPVALGAATWTCLECQARYDTSGVDTERFARRLASIKRWAWAGAVVILAVLGVLATFRPAVLLVAPVILGGYYFCYLPRYRKQLRALYESLPQWHLTRT